eukprot:Skav217914  [mRNA]  locus=scaffold795:265946:267685:- [translate_table: standard]
MSADWADDRWRQIEAKLTHVMNEVFDLKEKTEKNEVKCEKKVTDVAASMLEMLKDVQNNHSQLAEQLQRLQEEFEASQKGHDALQSKLDSNDSKISDVEEGLRQEMKDSTSKISAVEESLRQEMKDSISKISAMEEGLRQEMKNSTSKISAVEDGLQQEMKSSTFKISDLEGGLREEMKIIRDDCERKLADLAPKLEDLKSQSEHVDRLTSQLDNLGNVYDDVKFLQGETLRLDGLCRRVSGFAARQVEWHVHIDDIRRAAGGDVPTSLFSPQFEAAGVSGLQLELRAHVSSSSSGDEVSLHFWAFAGLQLVFKFFLGRESEILCHSFDGKTPCVLKQMNSFDSILKQKSTDGLLHCGVQILESIAAVEKVEPETYGTLLMQNYCNNRLLELMDSRLQMRVDVAHSGIRRFHWRIQGPFFVEHQDVFRARVNFFQSLPFDAAGLKGMQLQFYPLGFPGASPGYCSVFVSRPLAAQNRSWPRCWLWAARGCRSKPNYSVSGRDFLGRLDFAQLGTIIDPKDQSVNLVLEIEEAQHASEPSLIHQTLDTGTPEKGMASIFHLLPPVMDRPLTSSPRSKRRA